MQYFIFGGIDMNLIQLAENLYQYLIDNGIRFTDDGYPILTDEMILKEMPKQVIPFGQTYACKDKGTALLVSFCKDEIIYRKLLTLEKDVPKYKQYLGFGGFDLSPRINWNINLQKFNILLNCMANTYLALHGVKILPNFRIGCLETINVLNIYPKNCWYSMGTLGCARGHVKINKLFLQTKLIVTNPDMLLIYGNLKPQYKEILDCYGIPYKVFYDFQYVSRGKDRI